MEVTEQAEDLKDALRQCGTQDDADISVAKTAIVISGLLHPGLSLDRYYTHLEKLVISAHTLFQKGHGQADNHGARFIANILKEVLCDEFSYEGDRDTYDDLQNADIVRVIDRRKGMPIALAILAMHIADSLDCDVYGLNMPGHFLIRIDRGGEQMIVDPFNAFETVDAADLRRLIKAHIGPQAEMSTAYYAPVSKRDVLVRLMNNHKFRLIEQEAYDEALNIIEMTRLFAPQEEKLLFEAGILYAREGQHKQAVSLLEDYIDQVDDQAERAEAQALLHEIKHMMN